MEQPSETKTESSGEFNDLSPIYPHFTVGQWKKIHRLVNKTEDKKLLIVWVNKSSICQSVKSLVLYGNSEAFTVNGPALKTVYLGLLNFFCSLIAILVNFLEH